MARKIRIMLGQIRGAIQGKLRNKQAGFRSRISCVDHICIIIEEAMVWQKSLEINFIAFKKTFDKLNEDKMLKIMHYPKNL